MDETDEKVLNWLKDAPSISHAKLVRTYEIMREGKRGTYAVVVKVTEDCGEQHERFTVEAHNKESGKRVSSNSFPTVEAALATTWWAVLED